MRNNNHHQISRSRKKLLIQDGECIEHNQIGKTCDDNDDISKAISLFIILQAQVEWFYFNRELKRLNSYTKKFQTWIKNKMNI